MDALFELERCLQSAQRAEYSKYHGPLLKLLLERVVLRCGESCMSRELAAHCLLLLLELNSNSLQHVYTDVINLMQHREQSQRLAGMAMSAARPALRAASSAALLYSAQPLCPCTASALCCAVLRFSVLVRRFGQQMVRDMGDAVAVLVKLSKREELVCRELSLGCVSALYVGIGGPRSSDSASLDVVKLLTRLADKSSEKALRCASASCIDVIMRNSSDGRELQSLLPVLVKALLDADIEVRFLSADVLGRCLFSCTQKDASRLTEAQRRSRPKYDIRTVDDALDTIHKLFATAPHYKLKASLSVCLTRLMLCSVDGVDDSVVAGYVMTIIGFVFKTSGPDSEREGRQLAACISDAVIVGILQRQRERGLEMIARSIIAALHANHASDELNEYQIMLACDCLSAVFNRLSSAVEHLDIKDAALDVLLFLLTSSSHSLRLYAAQCFRCLARAASSHIATWLSVMEKIIAIQLSEVFDGGRGKDGGSSGVDPYWSLHGHLSALTAVVGVIPECAGGVSIAMLDSVFEVSKRLIGVEAAAAGGPQLTVPASALNECGWTLLAALIGLGSEWVAPRLNALFNLWRNVLGRSPPSTPQKVDDIAADLRVRGKALVALRSFSHVMRHRIVVQGAGQFSPVLKATRVFLCTNFSLVKALQSAKDLEPVIVAALATVKPVLMDLFTAIPPAAFTSYFSRILKFIVAEFTAASPAACTEIGRLLNPADHSLLFTPGAEGRMQRFIDLHRPLSQAAGGARGGGGGGGGRDDGDLPDEAQYVCVDSRCGGGAIAVDYSWNWCLRPDSYTFYSQTVGDDADGSGGGSGGGGGRVRERKDDEELAADVEAGSRSASRSSSERNNMDHLGLHAFECFESAALRSINACIRLFAAIYADQSATYQEQLVRHLLALVSKHRAAGNLAANTVLNIAAALLAVCRDQAQRSQPVSAPNALTGMVSIATELLAAPSPLVRRAAAEAIGLLVQVEDDAFLSRMTSVLRDQLASKDVHVLCAAVFAFGCLHRYGGGMKTIRALTFTVASLQLMGRDFTEPLRLWILHALWLTVETGGLSFAAYAQPTLSIVWSHAMHDCEARAPVLTLTIGRILHSVIAALGPEVSQPASLSASSGLGVERFLNLYSALQSDSHSLVQVQVVETASQLVLWGAVSDEERLVMLLVSGMADEEEELRRCCVKCVLRWGEKDAGVISRAGMAGRLLQLLDRESSHHVVALVRHALSTFIKLHSVREAGRAGERPTRWHLLDVLKRAMVGAAHRLPSDGGGGAGGPAAGAGGAAREQREKEGSKPDDDEDEDETIVSTPKAAAASSSPSSSGSSSAGSSGASAPSSASSEYRWQTKAFALDSLSQLLQTVRAAPSLSNEFDLSYARRHSSYASQHLVQQLPDLLTVACMATASTFDCLRIRGTTAMLHIVRCYQDVRDPDGEGDELLLQLYSAQVTSALSASMKNKSETIGSAPQLRAAACELSVVYLSSGVMDDEQVVQRMCRLLLTPLQRPQDVQLWYAQYDGNMATMVLLAHLSALCQLHLHTLSLASAAAAAAPSSSARRRRRDPRTLALQCTASVLAPHLPWLQRQYLLALRDYAVVLVTAKKDMQRTRGSFFDGAAATRVMDTFAAVWHVFLRALAEVGLPAGEPLLQPDGGGAGSGGSSGPLLLVSVVLSTLHTIFAYEVLAVNRRRGVDTSGSEAERQREQKQVLTCLSSLPSLLTAELLASPSTPAVDLLAELLPLLCWAMQHRLAAEPAVVQPRQQAAVQVLAAVIAALDAVMKGAAGGASRLSGGVVSVAELLHAVSELLAVAVYQHLPLPWAQALSPSAATPSSAASASFSFSAASAPPSCPALASGETYVTAEAAAFLSAVLRLLPHHAALWVHCLQAQQRLQASDRRDEATEASVSLSPLAAPFPFSLSAYVAALLHLCLHVVRTGDATLASLATATVRGLLLALSLADAQQPQPLSVAGLGRALADELMTHLQSPLAPSSLFRLGGLLTALWLLASSPLASSRAAAAADELLGSTAAAPPLNPALLHQLAAVLSAGLQSSPACQAVVLDVLQLVIFAPDASPASALLAFSTQAAARLLLSLLAPALLSLLHSASSASVAAHVARALTAACTSPSLRADALLAVVIPCLVSALPSSPSCLTCITALATAHPLAFKHCVAALSVQLKTQLQTAALTAQTEAGAAAAAGGDEAAAAAAAAAETGTASERRGGRDKAGKKRRGGARGDSMSLNANDEISLSTDFSAFAAKKKTDQTAQPSTEL